VIKLRHLSEMVTNIDHSDYNIDALQSSVFNIAQNGVFVNRSGAGIWLRLGSGCEPDRDQVKGRHWPMFAKKGIFDHPCNGRAT
jgi:hypothetical protein